MKKGLIVLVGLVIIGVILVSWGTGKYNGFVEKEETVNQAWSQVENVYQRRYDLIPNLVETVKGYAKQEQEVFIEVTNARSRVGGMVNISPDVLNDPAQLANFQQAQSSLGAALQRLLLVVERYPDLKSDKNFRDLQVQLEGTENRITVERRRFNEVVQNYNTNVRRFPDSIFAGIFGFSKKSYFQMESGADKAPKVQF